MHPALRVNIVSTYPKAKDIAVPAIHIILPFPRNYDADFVSVMLKWNIRFT